MGPRKPPTALYQSYFQRCEPAWKKLEDRGHTAWEVSGDATARPALLCLDWVLGPG